MLVWHLPVSPVLDLKIKDGVENHRRSRRSVGGDEFHSIAVRTTLRQRSTMKSCASLRSDTLDFAIAAVEGVRSRNQARDGSDKRERLRAGKEGAGASSDVPRQYDYCLPKQILRWV